MTGSPFVPPGPEAKVFVISVAAELSGLHPQTLRTYDRLGIVEAGRTGGGGRRYSLRDIELLRTVAQLSAEGLGLEGVKRVIALENQVMALQQKVAELQTELAAAHHALGTVQNLPVLAQQAQISIWRRPAR
ncbi:MULTISPECIES: heat shock protein transcriptional repressor HspR [unclassified Aeromicrobium]|uniref:heat shock protein transcriptional repressor HspR n=1 Tax=unclassified Aeromicrobium TaxID=2633570 RepID=UPI0006FACD79|nr:MULTISPECIES: MerR family transcriptional regulator [unclassified Aeromicrobium]RYY51162.1 MAG: MerR family transcriptional regulator [Actinomycetales bacterium]KQO36461.1 MerR family transcriptional regulator [Aeromicrobium sp. Leaf245]KQP27929.1 MerR family transcriptional regulator [Aeromicrobium sp. Leaf272]KQP78317.1 MerR family transcriptional regulator [Aeromicrobium sp. Leaf289]KQP84028.1 MerR family transcriptional regulator [Aeromicrobium sp. Leaf291]